MGSSPNFNCFDSLSTTMTYIAFSRSHKAPRPPNGAIHYIHYRIIHSLLNTFNIIYPFYELILTAFVCSTGGRSGICWPTFESNHNNGPQKPLTGLMSYNAIAGIMTVSGESQYVYESSVKYPLQSTKISFKK